MKKILVCNVREDERPALEAYKQAHQDVELVLSPASLSQSADLLDSSIDAISIQQRDKLHQDMYERMQELGIAYISTRTAGYDMIDLEACKIHGIHACNVPAYSPRSVAEHALMQIFKLLRKSPEIDRRVRNHDYRWHEIQGKEIHSVCIGIIGVGRIGGTLAKLCHALGAKVLGYDLIEREEMKPYLSYVSKEELLKQADVVSLHVDLNPSSEGLIRKADLKLMGPESYLVNASRGPVVNTAELIEALEEGLIAGAALDTVEGEEDVFTRCFEHEAYDDKIMRLQALDQVILTPHIAFYTNVAVQNMVDISLDDLCLLIEGKSCEHEL